MSATVAVTARYEKMVRLGCVVCRVYYEVHSEPHMHHLQGIEYRGAGMKSDDDDTIPLCFRHHQNGSSRHPSVHGQPKLFREQFGTQDELLEMTNTLLARIP